jgi:class 3 adenylate cyclase
MKRRLAAILCTDIVGFSHIVGLDEADTFLRLKALRAEVLEPAIASHDGHIISYAGDGALAEFPSVVRAVECALTIQNTVAERELNLPSDRRLVLRIGIHLGDILADNTNDVCGDAVNIAARLEPLAEPGGICLSDQAHEAIVGRIDAAFAYGGEPPLKNIGHEVGVWFWPAKNHDKHALKRSRAALDRSIRLRGIYWPTIFENVPPRDLNFTGRKDALRLLHRLLVKAQRPAAIIQAAIHGLGGIGKTSLAAEYAYHYAGEYAGVWWAPAETRTGLVTSLAALAARLEPRLADEADQEKAARAVLAHLARSIMPYLLVLGHRVHAG